MCAYIVHGTVHLMHLWGQMLVKMVWSGSWLDQRTEVRLRSDVLLGAFDVLTFVGLRSCTREWKERRVDRDGERCVRIHFLLTLLSWPKSRLICCLKFSHCVPVRYWAAHRLWLRHRRLARGHVAETQWILNCFSKSEIIEPKVKCILLLEQDSKRILLQVCKVVGRETSLKYVTLTWMRITVSINANAN